MLCVSITLLRLVLAAVMDNSSQSLLSWN